jgi:hypothetical protein
MGCQTITDFRRRLSASNAENCATEVSSFSSTLHSNFPDHLEKDWRAVTGNCIFMEPDYLRSVEKIQDEIFQLRMLMVYKDGRPVLTACFNLTGFIANDLKSNLHGRSRFIRTLSSALRRSKILERKRILICGSAFSTGEHAFFHTNDISREEAGALLMKAANQIIREEERDGIRVAAVLMKDFFPASKDGLFIFKKIGFTTFEVDHNMVMPILPEWKTYEDYLNSMNSKFRTKAKAALNKSASLISTDLDVEEIISKNKDLRILFDQVVGNADFSLGKMNLDALPELKRNMKERFVCRLFELNGEPVGFLTAIVNSTCVEAFLVGIDYKHNKAMAIYNRMLLEYVRIAIESGKSYIFFSRTASEIKTTVGAYPVEMTCCIRHPGRIGNFLINILFSYVKASPFEQREPYLVKVEERTKEMMEVFSKKVEPKRK